MNWEYVKTVHHTRPGLVGEPFVVREASERMYIADEKVDGYGIAKFVDTATGAERFIRARAA